MNIKGVCICMRNLGNLVLAEKSNFIEKWYVIVDGITVIIAKNKFETSLYSDVGEINVHHSGNYMGSVDDMNNWICNSIFKYLQDSSIIVKDGENLMGDTFWKWA